MHHQPLILIDRTQSTETLLTRPLESYRDWLTQRGFTLTSTNQVLLTPAETSTTIGIDQVRQLKKQLGFAPYSKTTRVVVFKPAELLTVEAQNALLKVLEEPPDNTAIVLIISRIESILSTVQSRCQQVYFKPEQKAHSKQQSNAKPFRANLSYTQIIELAKQHKDREAAAHLLDGWLTQTNLPAQSRQLIQLARHQLEKNFNVRLVLEQLLFQLKSRNLLG